MISAMIFAGGTGTRMTSSDIPKQFIKVDEKPIIIRTLENFSTHPEIDQIVVACLKDWIGTLQELIQQYHIQKVAAIVAGGSTGYESIHNGLLKVNENAAPSDIVLICDGVRPMISPKLIRDCIQNTREHQSAVPVVPSIDSVLMSEDGQNCNCSMPRGKMFITQAPQGYTMEKIMWAHTEAQRRGILNSTSSSELLIELGETIHIFMGERDNIKVTTPEDILTLRSQYYYNRFRTFAEEELKYGL